ncbi:MAG: fibronectin type III domain-containing protein, partial [Actinomycetota bacterium]|nr:fibronectin type III domain-containing protein [Actinomycetota bacterium]
MTGSKPGRSHGVGRFFAALAMLSCGLLGVVMVGRASASLATAACIAPNGSVVITNAPAVQLLAAPPRSPGVVTSPPTPAPPAAASTTPSVVRSSRSAVAATGSTVAVTFHGFPAPAQAALQAAADIWAAALNSAAPITLDATWAPATDARVLASTAPTLLRRVNGSVWYPQALADRINGSTIDPGAPDIVMDVNSQPVGGWYLGTDGHPPAGQYDLTTAVVHEMAHGLGIFGLLNVDSTGIGSLGAGQEMNLPTVFDNEVANGSGQNLVATQPNPSAGLAAALQSTNLVFGGAEAAVGNAGVAPRLFAPATWQPGSSVYHTDFSMFPAGSTNALMDPGLPSGVAIHDPGPVVEGMLDDLGWVSVAGRPTAVAAVSGTGQAAATVTWSPPVFNGNSPVTGYVVTAVGPNGQVAAEQMATGSRATVAGLATDTTYAVAVQAVNAAGRGPASQAAQVTIGTSSGPTTTTTTTSTSTTTSPSTTSTTSTTTASSSSTTTAGIKTGAAGQVTTPTPGPTTTTSIPKCSGAATT